MATRSTIWIKNEDNTYRGIYCHWNGGLEHNGKILFEHYQDKSKVLELISLGRMSLLAAECSHPIAHTFRLPIPGYCVFYHRDRGDPLENIIALNEFQTKKERYSYIYQNNSWYFSQYKNPYQLITEANFHED